MAAVSVNPAHELATQKTAEYLQGYADGCDRATERMPMLDLLPDDHRFVRCDHCLGEGKLLTRITMYTRQTASKNNALAYVDCQKACPECLGVGMVPNDVPRITKTI